jgi:5-methylcytosine-specific restriction endonuclease McrA
MKKKKITISDLIMEYYRNHPKEDLPHRPVITWVIKEYEKLYEKMPQDPWREIRKLHEEGILIKVDKGVYKYDPDLIQRKKLYEFSQEVKEAIFKKDGYQCVWCRRGRKDGIEIHADHIKPIEKGGRNTLRNGQTLCSEHNLLKKNYSQTEFGKRAIIKIYKIAIKKEDERMIGFCKMIFDAYNMYDLNNHIPRPNHK